MIPYTEPSISHREFLSGLDRIIEENQTEAGPCVGCRYLVKRKASHPATFFHTVTLHDFSGCNSSCVYCAGSEYQLAVPHQASLPHTTLFTNLLLSKAIRPGLTAVGWGGGEPTLLNTFADTVDMLRLNKIHQTINTNGIIFSESVARALAANQATVRISVDSGTDYGYEKVKRNPYYQAVWETIGKYARTRGDFTLKYIVLSLNANQDETWWFVARAQELGVRRICISIDAHLKYAHLKGKVSDREIEAAAFLYNEARKRHMAAYFEPIWSPADIAQIEKVGHFKAWRWPTGIKRQIKLKVRGSR